MEKACDRLEERIGRLERMNRVFVAALTILLAAILLVPGARVPDGGGGAGEKGPAGGWPGPYGRGRRHASRSGTVRARWWRIRAARAEHEGGAVLYLAGEGSLSIYDSLGSRTARFPAAER